MPWFLIWYMIAVLPFIILLESTQMFSDFLKRKNIYSHWDIWHSALLILIVLLLILYGNGYR